MSVQITEIRKIIKIGERSAGITIPKEWLNILGVTIGSKVEVGLGPRYIIVRPLGVQPQKTLAEITLTGKDVDILTKQIIASYIEGFDYVILDAPKDVARKSFYAIALRLPGTIAMDGDRVSIKISVDEFNTNINEVIVSMKSTISNMFDLLMEYFETKSLEALQSLLKLDDDLDRLHFLGVRTIKRTLFRNPQESLDKLVVIKSMEHIGDALDRVARTLMNVNPSFDNHCKEVFKDIFARAASYVTKSINALLESNMDLAIKILGERERLQNDILSSASKCINITGALALTHEAMVAIYEAAEIAEASTAKVIRELGEKTLKPKLEELVAAAEEEPEEEIE